jgi:hypothetical protein
MYKYIRDLAFHVWQIYRLLIVQKSRLDFILGQQIRDKRSSQEIW